MTQIQQRNIAVAIILTIVTCGIYGIYWLVCLTNDTNTASRDPQGTSGGMVVLLTIVTCGIYGWFWCYKQGERLDRACEMRNMPKSDKAVMYLIFSILGLAIVSYALMQDALNQIAAVDSGNGQVYQQYAQPQYVQPQYQPQQPYGQPQQPYGQQYAQPQQPVYGQPVQQPYGQPNQPVYGQPVQDQPQYGQPQQYVQPQQPQQGNDNPYNF